MTEADATDAPHTGIDYTAAKAALSSSSTKARISQLRIIDDRLKSKSK